MKNAAKTVADAITLVDKGIYRMRRPQSYSEVMALRDLGIGTILNLTGGLVDYVTYNANTELDWATRLRMRETHIDFGVCLPPAAQLLIDAVDIIWAARSKGILVHCVGGVDRTGMVCAMLRLLKYGWTYDRAVKEMLEMGFHNWCYWWWAPTLKTALALTQMDSNCF